MCSQWVAYALWLVGGVWGLHHLYLRRFCHAFTWFCTCGGFGLGWLWDLCELAFYVDERNRLQERLAENRLTTRVARCSSVRFAGQIVMGVWLGFMGPLLVPTELWHTPVGRLLAAGGAALGTACGVYMVGNIGLQKRRFMPALKGALWPSIAIIGILKNDQLSVFYVLTSAVQCNWSATWRVEEARFGFKHFFAWVLVYLCVWISVLSFNVKIAYNGRTITLFSAFSEMGREWKSFQGQSGDFENFADYILHADRERKSDDFSKFFEYFTETRTLVPPSQVEAAYKKLKLSRKASAAEVKSRCRALLKQTHPDRVGPQGSDEFMRVRAACDLLAPRRRAARTAQHDEF